jgi:hypothetical protein
VDVNGSVGSRRACDVGRLEETLDASRQQTDISLEPHVAVSVWLALDAHTTGTKNVILGSDAGQ